MKQTEKDTVWDGMYETQTVPYWELTESERINCLNMFSQALTYNENTARAVCSAILQKHSTVYLEVLGEYLRGLER